MRGLVKLLLICALLVCVLFNYKYITFSQGISKPNYNDKGVLEVLQAASSIKSVRYYKKTIAPKSDSGVGEYKVYIETPDDAYLLDATADDIAALDTLSIFNSNLQPKKVVIVPFYVEIIVALIILVLPLGKRKKTKKTRRKETQTPQA